MKIQQLIAVFWLLGLAACQSGSSGDEFTNEVVAARALPSNSDIIAMAYDNSYQKPATFFVDERADTERSYSVYHVKDPSVSYELCTDNYAEAFDWEAIDNASRSVTGDSVDSYENAKYFEFVRELAYSNSVGNVSGSTSPGFARIFKCSYVNRDGVDRNLRTGYAGTLNTRPIVPETIRNFSEYLWTYTFFWPGRAKVMQTISSQRGNTYRHTLVLAVLTSLGTDKCDLIEVIDWEFSVDTDSGQITKEFRPVFDLEAELVDGVPQVCGE